LASGARWRPPWRAWRRSGASSPSCTRGCRSSAPSGSASSVCWQRSRNALWRLFGMP
jgi:hypothetical protein